MVWDVTDTGLIQPGIYTATTPKTTNSSWNWSDVTDFIKDAGSVASGVFNAFGNVAKQVGSIGKENDPVIIQPYGSSNNSSNFGNLAIIGFGALILVVAIIFAAKK